jgi:hypothetical protein
MNIQVISKQNKRKQNKKKVTILSFTIEKLMKKSGKGIKQTTRNKIQKHGYKILNHENERGTTNKKKDFIIIIMLHVVYVLVYATLPSTCIVGNKQTNKQKESLVLIKK